MSLIRVVPKIQLPPLKTHQCRGLDAIEAQRLREPAIPTVGVAPPGGGKSRVMTELTWRELQRGGRVVLAVHRKMLLEQLRKDFVKQGMPHGVLAAGYSLDLDQPVQLASTSTLFARGVRTSKVGLPPATLLLKDEAHQQTGDMAKAIVYGSYSGNIVQEGYAARGTYVLGFTATPLMEVSIYQRLIEFGSYSELRAAGMHQLVKVFGPDEIDTTGLKMNASGEFSEKKLAERVEWIFGSVFDEWKKLNPDGYPAILYAPSVPSSRWFAQQFMAKGVPVAHIDGETCLIPEGGKLVTYEADRDARDRILEMSRSGEIKILMNRFVLREAIDMPWLYHGIFATVMGGLTTYLQSVGRLQRYCPSYTYKILQCHGGCLDDETEILTDRGWLGRTEIEDDDRVAGYDRETGEISWQPILHRHDRPLEAGERMYEVKSRCLDLRITGNHRLLGQRRTMDKANRPRWPDGFQLRRVDEIAPEWSRFRIPISGQQSASGVDLSDDELRFLGWWITDGTKAGKREQVSITQADHQPHIRDLRACLDACGFDYIERPHVSKTLSGTRPATQFSIPKGTCKSRPRRGWWKYRDYLDKDLSPLLEAMDARQFRVFLEAVHLGDGAKDRNPGSYRICSGNRTFVDRLQSLAVRRGYKCNVYGSTKFTIDMQDTNRATVHGSRIKTNQAALRISASVVGERVWCVANPLETIVVRRRGKVAIIGNSYWRHGSPNEDREWRLGVTQKEMSRLRIEAIVRGEKQEGIRCPKCGCWRMSGPVCANENCRHTHSVSVRAVRSITGRLKAMEGSVYVRAAQFDEANRLWYKTLYSASWEDQPVSSAVARYIDAANRAGIVVDLPALRNPPPPEFSESRHRSVRAVYPWTMRKVGRPAPTIDDGGAFSEWEGN